jgi:hypothetical protein
VSAEIAEEQDALEYSVMLADSDKLNVKVGVRELEATPGEIEL